MENSCKETILNLARSFAGESQARERYWIYAQVARKEGYEWIARVFEETADNEAVHAEEFLERMQKLGGCADNTNITATYYIRIEKSYITNICIFNKSKKSKIFNFRFYC